MRSLAVAIVVLRAHEHLVADKVVASAVERAVMKLICLLASQVAVEGVEAVALSVSLFQVCGWIAHRHVLGWGTLAPSPQMLFTVLSACLERIKVRISAVSGQPSVAKPVLTTSAAAPSAAPAAVEAPGLFAASTVAASPSPYYRMAAWGGARDAPPPPTKAAVACVSDFSYGAAASGSFGAAASGSFGGAASGSFGGATPARMMKSESISHTDDKESVDEIIDVLLTEFTALVHSVSATPLCQSALSTPSWLSLLLALGVYGPVSVQRRSMRLLRQMVPATRPGSLVLDLPAARFSSERGSALTLVTFLLRLVAISLYPQCGDEVEAWPGLYGAPYIMSSRASECIALLRSLLGAPEHHSVVESELEVCIRRGISLREARIGVAAGGAGGGGGPADQEQLRTLAVCASALCVTGGYVELVRAGGSVRVVKSPGASRVDRVHACFCHDASAYR